MGCSRLPCMTFAIAQTVVERFLSPWGTHGWPLSIVANAVVSLLVTIGEGRRWGVIILTLLGGLYLL